MTRIIPDDWLSAWPDALAFAAGLAVAWWAGWSSADLVWTLWLSSLVVGYATIVWMIVQPASELARAALRERASWPVNQRGIELFWVLLIAGAGAVLAFFTLHFVFFHYVHSQILLSFFPIDAGQPSRSASGMAIYAEIVRRYWAFLPSAFLAHRAAFLRKPLSLMGPSSVVSMVREKRMGSYFGEPYRNVMRMHALLFFFAIAHFARLENFAIYAVVYAVYFFPWRLVRRPTAAGVAGIDTRTPTELRAI
jgi:hypothetical protein